MYLDLTEQQNSIIPIILITGQTIGTFKAIENGALDFRALYALALVFLQAREEAFGSGTQGLTEESDQACCTSLSR